MILSENGNQIGQNSDNIQAREQAWLKLRVSQLEDQRERIARILAEFYETPIISIAALQPILDLARELNPRLR